MNLVDMLLGPRDRRESLVWLQRKETWIGDLKANRIRLGALAIFTINEFINYNVLHVVDHHFHVGVLAILALWIVCAAIFGLLLRFHFLPRVSPYLMVSLDLLLLTWVLVFAEGPRSPLVTGYFLIIALSGIRFDPRVCLYSTGASILGYLAVLEFVKLQKPEFLVPIFHAVIVVIALVLMGIIMAHLISRVLTLLNERMRTEAPR